MNSDNKRRYSLFPKTLATCIEPLTRPLFKTQGSAATRLITQWNTIAGPHLARHTRVEKLSFPTGKKIGGTLTIAIENGFATEFQHRQPAILDRLADYFGYRAISRITISHTFSANIEPQKIAPRPAALPPECRNVADSVEDGELKAALASLAKTLSGPRT